MSWQKRLLSEVCQCISRGISPKYIDKGGIFVLNQKCIKDHKVNYSEARQHDFLIKKFDTKKLIQLGDVLVNSTGVGTLGRVAQIKKVEFPTTVDSHITIVRPSKEIFDIYFFGWLLISIENVLKQMGAGASGQTELSRVSLGEVWVNYPESISEQRRIVKILDDVFEKIAKVKENAEKNLQNSKELFESYLQSVFVNPGGDWGEKRFDEICVLQRGFDLPTRLREAGNFPLVSSNGITDRVKIWKVKAPGVVTGRSGTIGSVHFIEENFWPLNTSLYIKDFCGNDERFIFYFLKQFDLGKYSSGAGVPTLNRNNVHFVMASIPKSISEQKSIVVKLDALSVETKKLEAIYKQKIASLEELKKSVLKKAFSGEL